MNKAQQLALRCQMRDKSYSFYCHHCNQQMLVALTEVDYDNICMSPPVVNLQTVDELGFQTEFLSRFN